MNVVVFGGNGFLGRNLAQKLGASDNVVYCIYNRSYEKIPENVITLPFEDISSLLNQKIDIVYIAIGNYALSQDEFTSQLATINTICKMFSSCRIVFISSVMVYKNIDQGINVSNDLINENDDSYGGFKLKAESIVKKLLNFCIIRFTYIYGIGMSTNSLIPIWINHAISHQTINVYGNGQRKQDYLHVSDAVNLCIEAGKSTKNLIIIGATGKSISNIDLAKLIRNNIKNVQLKLVEVDNATSYTYDIDYTKQSLDWTPKTNLADGLNKLILNFENSNL